MSSIGFCLRASLDWRFGWANMDYIADVCDDFILRDGTCVPVRVKERRKMHEAYHHYFVDALCEGRAEA